MKNGKAVYSAKWIAYTAMLTALVVATSVIPPVNLGVARVYWCDGMIFLGAYLMDPLSAFVIGGLGSALYDFILQNVPMAVASLVIHGLQGAAVSALMRYTLKRLTAKREWIKAAIYSLVGAVIVILGYFLTYRAVFPLIMPNSKYGYAYAAARVLRNVIQEILGITLAMLACYATTFKAQLVKSNLLPDFKRDIKRAEATPPPEV